MRTVKEIIDRLSKLDPDLQVIIRDEIDILRNFDGNQVRKGIYEDFEVVNWTVTEEGKAQREETDEREVSRFVSFSFNDEPLRKKLTNEN